MIILTVPYNSPDSLLTSIPLGADYIEYRLDYCDILHKDGWNLFNSKTIITYRDKAEGGKRKISPEIKSNLFLDALHNSTALIDCEYLFSKKHPGMNIPPERLVLSLHTNIDRLDLIKDFIASFIPAKYYKLAISCDSIDQLDKVILMMQKSKKENFILIPTYPCSVSARLLYRLYDSCATYVHNDAPVIANQPSIELVNKCRIESINTDTQIYAIIGKEQILNSLSVNVYNSWFKQTNTNRVFLPIVAITSEQAMGLINWVNRRAKVKGVAITMPFKLSVSSIIDNTKQNINSWRPDSKSFTNTDAIAMKQAIEQTKLNKEASILIYGRGGTAKTARHMLEQLGYFNIHQLNRNEDRKSKSYQLLINCTPFGLNEADNPDLLPDFETLIDLPYGKQQTTLVRKAIANKLDYIEGLTFWKWQAQAQAEFFGLEAEFKDYLETLDLRAIVQ